MTPAPLPATDAYGEGLGALGGHALRLLHAVDALFLDWAEDAGADEWRFPPVLPASALERCGWLASFPHLMTVPQSLARDDAALRAFADAPCAGDGRLNLDAAAPARHVLTPAACYHVYLLLQGRDLDAPVRVTTRATCFRREARHEALRRQWAFDMREFVCVGTPDEVEAHLDAFRRRALDFFAAAALDVRGKPATDPFFDPRRSPGYALQKAADVKTELVCDSLALGSLNRHFDFFGRAFAIRRAGTPAASACVAFGLERVLQALLTRHGDGWPDGLRRPSERARLLGAREV